MKLPLDAQQDLSDDMLMERYAGGDQAAARALTSRHSGKVLNLGLRLLRDEEEAKDLTQEVMLKLWRQAGEWQAGKAKVSTWLYRVTYNAAIDRIRARSKHDEDPDTDPEDPSGDAENQLIRRERATSLMQAIDQLPERQKTAVILRHLEELSNPEISEILQLSVEAVESLLARARRRLRDILVHSEVMQ